MSTIYDLGDITVAWKEVDEVVRIDAYGDFHMTGILRLTKREANELVKALIYFVGDDHD